MFARREAANMGSAENHEDRATDRKSLSFRTSDEGARRVPKYFGKESFEMCKK